MGKIPQSQAAEPLQRDSLLLTTKSSGCPGSYLIDIGRMKDWLEPPSGFKAETCGLRIQGLKHRAIAQETTRPSSTLNFWS